MKSTQLFSNEFATIEADLQQKLIKVTWLQHASHTDLRAVLLKASEFARAEALNKWLYDLRELNFTTTADKSWSVQELFPTLNLDQKHYMACVATPQNVQLVADNMVQTAISEHPELANKIELEVFISSEAALQWLNKEKQSNTGAASEQNQ